MPFLLAQLVAPPLQNSPVRLPEPAPLEQRPAPRARPIPVELEPGPTPATTPTPTPAPAPSAPGGPPVEPAAAAPPAALPRIQGLSLYSPATLRRILGPCSALPDPGERLRACASTLSARLVSDGYVSTRVYVRDTPPPGFLEVVEGRLVELQVNGSDPRLNRRVRRLLAPLQGKVLQLPVVERQLQLLRRQPGIGSVRGNLTRLGSDPSQGAFRVTVEPGRQPWQGELALRNDGTGGSGQYRGVATALKPDLITSGDTLLLFGELDASDAPSLGTVITSLSYTYPLTETLNLTGAFGFSRRNLVELPSPQDRISTSQYQGLGQLEWVFHETLTDRWGLVAGFSANRSNTYFDSFLRDLFDGAVRPSDLPESVRTPSSGYLRFGVTGSGLGSNVAWNGGAYLLQGVGAATPATQRNELALAGIEAGQATAIGALVSASWGFAPSWQLNARAGGQLAFHPLTSPMQFVLGSDVGLRGLPGQLVSGDDGLLGTAELVWTFWESKRHQGHALQLVPFIGAGGVRTRLPSVTFSDTVGAGGLLVRWLAGDNWSVELGWVDQFGTNNNDGVWNDWLLGNGLYAKVGFRF